MGKKSKKAKGGSGAASRKEKLQERRERTLEIAANPEHHGEEYNDNNDRDRRYFVGDRVWFACEGSDGENPLTYRGIVDNVDDYEYGELRIVTLQSKIDGTASWVHVRNENVFPDFQDLTLRFNVGDQVLCRYQERWVAREVTHQWPIYEIEHSLGGSFSDVRGPSDLVPHYKCGHVAAPDDTDRVIMKHPTQFRFSVGEQVLFNTEWCYATGKSLAELKSADTFCQGVVTQVDITGKSNGYFVYECSFGQKNKLRCLIYKDNDEYVMSVDAEPRERLMQAIRQDCSPEHLIYLVSFYSIDVLTFRDLVVDKAIEYGSYNTILWLQESYNLDISSITDLSQNNLLHQIAKSANAERFIEQLASQDCASQCYLNVTGKRGKHSEPSMMQMLNLEGKMWLEILVEHGNIRCLDLVLSLHRRLSWRLRPPYLFDWDNILSLKDCIERQGNTIMKVIFDTFKSNVEMIQIYDGIQASFRETETELLAEDNLKLLNDETADAKLNAARFVRFINDWQGNTDDLGVDVFLSVIKNGFSHLFKLFYDADTSWFWSGEGYVDRNDDNNEYIQPQLSCKNEDDQRVLATYITACIIGDPEFKGDFDDYNTKQMYLKLVKQYFLSSDCAILPFVEYLKKEQEYNKSSRWAYNHHYRHLIQYKISLLQDSTSLDGRIQILSHIIIERPGTKIDVLMAIRHRQYGIVRWMVNKELIDLKIDARKADLSLEGFKVIKRVPSLPLGGFLCFAAIEYDDLFSLQMLFIDSYSSLTWDGMNLLHFASFLGRFEIAGWLCTTSLRDTHVSETCKHKELDGAYAVHIAAGMGHVELAEMLFECGCNKCDRNGMLPEHYAKRAPVVESISFKRDYKFAHEWAKEQSGEASFDDKYDKCVKQLLSLLKKTTPVGTLKDHILSTKCLDVQLWQNANYKYYNQRGMNGLSFQDIIEECFSFPDTRFAEWLVILLRMDSKAQYYDFFWKETSQTKKKKMKQADLLMWATENVHEEIAKALSHPLIEDIDIIDPACDIVFSLQSLESNKLRLQSQLIKVRTICAIEHWIRFRALPRIVINGGDPSELVDLAAIYRDLRGLLESEGLLNANFVAAIYDLQTIAKHKDLINMDSEIYGSTSSHNGALTKIPYFCQVSHKKRSELGIVLVSEGHTDLIRFCTEEAVGWTPTIEAEMVLAASFLGHTDIVVLFLNHPFMCTGKQVRYYEAMLGACTGGKLDDLRQWAKESNANIGHQDPIRGNSEHARESAISIIGQSLIGSAIYAYITDVYSDLSTISFLVNELKYTHTQVMYSMELALDAIRCHVNEAEYLLRFISLFGLLYTELHFQPVHHHSRMKGLLKQVIEIVERPSRKLPEHFFTATTEWFESLMVLIDLQGVEFRQWSASGDDAKLKSFCYHLILLKEKQRQFWAQFDVIKKGHPLVEVQQSILNGSLSTEGYDRGGMQLIHLAASYDRVDVLEWLVVEKGLDLRVTNGKNQTAQQVAEAARANATFNWIKSYKAKKTISAFVSHNIQRIKIVYNRQRSIRKAILIQRIVRGYFTRKIYGSVLSLRLEESHRFNAIWAPSLCLLPKDPPELFGWGAVRALSHDISSCTDVEQDTVEKLDDALSKAIVEDSIENITEVEEEHIELSESCLDKNEGSSCCHAHWSNMFQISSHVVKFLKSGDLLYRSFFVRRMQQLANGDRSRILQKRLKGSQNTIYETYLEQKSGFRILWTEEGDTIVVWFVAKHKSVSRLVRLIDDAKSRSARQPMTESILDATCQSQAPEKVLLDVGNTPLKVYDLSFHELDNVAKASWTPQLHLTDEERKVVESNGSVLLLGRSGTGKTVCICNRMEMDFQRHHHDPTFTQLFVSRSARLCKYVKEVVSAGQTCSSQSFLTFRELLYQLDTSLPRSDGTKCFNPSSHVNYYRFSREFYVESRSLQNLSSLLVWKTIQTFLKGSIEAFQRANHVLDKEYFLSGSLGKNRCRIDHDQLNPIYEVFLDYQKYLQSKGLWDDCDRVVSLLLRMEQAKANDPSVYETIRKSRVYVDEIQDYRQVELLLYFCIGGPGGLFLAGDPAQSVVEGTDFRFEEIRSVGYFVAGNDTKHIIPQKPLTVNVNFRSHSGILNVAAAVLDYLFAQFPSTKQLKRDHGLYEGPRPGVCHNVGSKKLLSLFREKLEGVVVLTHDESAARWKRILDYPLVYGIRESKGLEFKSVIILDFFAEISQALQKPFRDLILNRAGIDYATRYPLVENILKLLYTGVTRSIEQLYFVETRSSVAGDATLRWLTTTTTSRDSKLTIALATKSNINNLDSMSMTCDEWIVAGIENAEMAEEEEVKLLNALSLLDRSVYCFEQAQSLDLAAKARAQRQSVHFREELAKVSLSSTSKNDLTRIEQEAALIFATLLAENLLGEARHIIDSILPMLTPYTREQLEKKVYPKIQIGM